MNDGISRINGERQRQLTKHTYSGDDKYAGGELRTAAIGLLEYISQEPELATAKLIFDSAVEKIDADDDGKPTQAGRIRALEIAGALIAAEIDREVRLSYKVQKHPLAPKED